MRAKHRLAHTIKSRTTVPGPPATAPARAAARPGPPAAGLDATRATEAAIKGATAGITRALTTWLLDHWTH